METAIRKEESENLSKEDESVQFLHIRDYYILHFFFIIDSHPLLGRILLLL